MGRRHRAGRRVSGPLRPGHGLHALRAHVRGLAGGLPAHRPPRLLQQLRGLHPHRGLHVLPACQVAQGLQRAALAAGHRLPELYPLLQRLAAGPQRLHPPGPRFPGPRGQQEGRRGADVSAPRCQLPALLLCPLHQQPELCERARHLQAPPPPVADHGAGREALHPGHRHLAVGLQRPGRGAGHRPGLLRRHTHPGDAGRR